MGIVRALLALYTLLDATFIYDTLILTILHLHYIAFTGSM